MSFSEKIEGVNVRPVVRKIRHTQYTHSYFKYVVKYRKNKGLALRQLPSCSTTFSVDRPASFIIGCVVLTTLNRPKKKKKVEEACNSLPSTGVGGRVKML